MIRRLRPLCWLPLLLAALASSSAGYYHFVHYRQAGGPYEPVVEKFDLESLVDQTVYFYVSSQGPELSPNDSYEGLLSHLRQALAVWDAVPTSSLRVAYGGIVEGSLNSRGPAGEILFAELPPGVIGLGGPVTRGDERSGFVPIVRSQVILSNDLTQGDRPRPSFSELFFNSAVHEIGHALGLQHTLTSAAMSTDVTRATSRAQPLAADDIAGLSVLYPAPGFETIYGGIAGRVLTSSGEPAALASVVAVSRSGAVVSALTAPDGAYRIDGLLPGPQLVYVHPLPPATQEGLGPANIVLPRDENDRALLPSGPFQTIFYGGSNRPEQAVPVEVTAGQQRSAIDFRVRPRVDLPPYNVTTYSFPGNGAPAVHPAFVTAEEEPGFLVATGIGLMERVGQLTVEALGADLQTARVRPYGPDPRFARIDFGPPSLGESGPKHLIFRLPDDIYVLPSGVQFTTSPAPVIHWVTPSFALDGTPAWTLRGVGFDPLSLVFFDGAPATITAFDPTAGEIVLLPPVGPPGHRAVVTVYNPDGQSSAFTLPDGNVIFEYPGGPPPAIQILPDSAPPDSDLVVEIRGSNTHFVPGETIVGFGSSDIVTRTVTVLSPTRLKAAVTLRADAAPGEYLVSATSGLEVLTLPRAFRVVESITAGSGQRPRVRFGSLLNSATMQPDLSPGVLASLFGENLSLGSADQEAPANAARPRQGASQTRVTLNGQAALLLSVAANRIDLQVPATLEPGTAELRVDNGAAASEPMLVQIGRVSPGLFQALHPGGRPIEPGDPAQPGQPVILLATGFGATPPSADPLGLSGPSIQVLFGDSRLPPLAIEPDRDLPGLYRLRFSTPRIAERSEGAASVPLSLLVDGRRSNVLRLALSR